jgi:glucokinase
MDKNFCDLGKQAEEHECKISEQIKEQTSHISQEIIVLKQEMGAIHMDLQSIRQSSEKEAIDVSSCCDFDVPRDDEQTADFL